MATDPQIQQLLERGDMRGAFDRLASAAGRGDVDALRELGIWFLDGKIVRRDLSKSRDCFRAAADRGDFASRQVISAFLSVGVGGPKDWPAAIDYLERAALSDPLLAASHKLLIENGLSASACDEREFAKDVVADDPHIYWVRGFLSAAECDLLVDFARPVLTPSVIVDPATNQFRPDPIRTSDNAMFPWPNETPWIHSINCRIAAATGIDVANGEPLQILNYQVGREYRKHSDALPAEPNQRVVTALIYLNGDYEGGETSFPSLDLTLRGGVGDMLVFSNVDRKGAPHPLAQHIGEPVTSGQKWLASRWIRAGAFGNPRG